MTQHYAVLQYAQGVSGEDSLLAWASVPFQCFDRYEDANKEAVRVNSISTSSGLPAKAFVARGTLTTHIGFVIAKE